MKILTPAEITKATLEIGCAKAAAPAWRLWTQSIMAGSFIAFGGILSVIVGFGFPEATAANPSLQRLLSGMMFPIGLILVVVLGAELFTGNNALLIPGCMQRRFGWKEIARNWTIVYLGNFIGALLFAYFLVYLSGLTASAPYDEAICRIARAKVSMTFWQVLLKGIGANWCVCLAVARSRRPYAYRENGRMLFPRHGIRGSGLRTLYSQHVFHPRRNDAGSRREHRFVSH